MEKQYIFILDLDGTIIGDCKYLCELYNLGNILKKSNFCKNILQKAYNSEKSKLIRPYFLYFYKNIKKIFPNSKFYIYTASCKKWAYKEISIIEKQNNIKFNRPIYTRDDCILKNNGERKKSIIKILKNKYKNEEIIIIDNNNNYIDNTDKIIKCPTYNYQLFYNLWDYIPNKINSKELKTYIEYLINNKLLSPFNNNSNNIRTKIKAYKWLYKQCNTININKDYFWKKITKIIIKNDIKNFDKNIIKQINSFFN